MGDWKQDVVTLARLLSSMYREATYSGGTTARGTGAKRIVYFTTARLPVNGLRSKDWEEFGRPGAPKLDFVFTVCDKAAKEVCPIWPGQPMTAHWGVPDPAAVKGPQEEIDKAFRDAFMILDRRIGLFLCLPLSSLDTLVIQKNIEDIGRR